MADNQQFVQTQPFTMAGAGPAIGATSILLSSFKQIDGTTLLTMADFGNKGYATLEPNSGTQEESITFTGVVQNSNGTATLTGVSTVSFVAPYTETPGLLKAHAGGTLLVISNTSAFYNGLSSKNDDETITGTWTFTAPNYPRIDTPAVLPTDDAQFATKKYVDGVAVSGAPNAAPTVKGIVQLATSAQTKAGTNTGSTGASLVALPSDIAANVQNEQFVYWTDSGAANALVITPAPAITAYAAGQKFNVKVATANTTASTINVNGLGIQNIKKFVNSALSNLEANDLRPGAVVSLVYDGTQFLLQTPSAAQMTTTNAQSANTFFGVSTMTGAQANTLVGGTTSNADALHTHNISPSYAILASLDPSVSTVSIGKIGSDANGTSFYLNAQYSTGGGTSVYYVIYRYLIDSVSKNYYYDSNVNSATLGWITGGSADALVNPIVGSTYLYTAANLVSGSTVTLKRCNLDFSSPTSMTISGTASTSTLSLAAGDDTRIFLYVSGSTTVLYYTVSGTVATRQADITMPFNQSTVSAFWFDGTYLYAYSTTGVLYRVSIAGATQASVTRLGLPMGTIRGIAAYKPGGLYIIGSGINFSSTVSSLVLQGVTKP